ncbi:MAG: hydroxyacid dehydrogenase [Candidatus Bathyarchaeia archaeon]
MTPRFKILVTESIDEAGIRLLEEAGQVQLASSTSQEVLENESRDKDAIIIRALGTVTEQLIVHAPRLKVVGRHGVGVDNVDVRAATRHGVVVVYTPEANAEAVADYTIGLVVAVARRIVEADRALRAEAGWKARYELIGSDVHGKTLGIIGLGRIGLRVARRARGFDMRLLAYDPYVTAAAASQVGAELVNLRTLLRKSDIVTIHVPLTEETRHLLGRSELNTMKPGAILVNASRGGVVDEDALIEALTSGRLGGAGLDVFEKEPVSSANPLLSMRNVVVSPHMAAHSKESLREMAVTVAGDVVRVLKGEKPKYPFNPEVFKGETRAQSSARH